MGYILLLFVVIGAGLSVFTGHNPLSDLLDKTKTTILDAALPKTETEINIDNLNQQHDILDRFFTEEVLKIVDLTSTTPEQKTKVEEFKKALDESKQLITNIEILEKKDKETIKSLVKNTLNLESEEKSPTPSASSSIPSNCQLVCEK
jgi:hypothetical protein